MKIVFTQHYKRLIMLCPIVIILLFVTQILYLSHFNAHEYFVKGQAESEKTYISFANRGDSTSVWLKRDYILDGKTVDLTGETIDGVFHNNSNDTVSQWEMRINIKQDSFINNAWCGTVEIHQSVGTADEIVQTVDLRNYTLDEIKLKYYYDGDLLIPLKKGDFIIYYPSAKDTEMPIEKNSELTMGMIFYHLNGLDFSDTELKFNYHRKISQGRLFYVIILLLIAWIISAIIYFVSAKIYEDAQHGLELKKSGISSMSDMYNTIYIVDLVKNEIVSVVAEEVSDLKRPDNLGADEQFKRLFELDSTEAFKDLVLEFADLSTLRDRMGNKNNIACEYVSKTRGWCRLRFFAMDYVEGQPVDRVVFTLQIIDSEKKEMDAIEEKVTKIEKEKKEMNAFLQIISREIIAPIEDTIKIEQRIIDESTDDKIKNYATQSKHAIYILGKLLGDVVEYSKLDTGDIHITETEYSFNDIIAEVEAELKRESDESQITFSKNIAQNVPDKLYGDAKHIKQCLSILLLSTAEVIKNGDIKLSVFAKEHDGKVHLLMSVRDNGPKTKLESQLLRDKLVNGILKLMGSELHNLDHDSDGNETYFEIEQVVRG